jgi:hypothetical protein
MRNKKSDLMTLKVNYGCFSGVGGIAGNDTQTNINQDTDLQILKINISNY